MPHPEVVGQEVQGELVLLHLGTEQYYGMDGVAMEIWRFLGQGLNREAILNSLAEKYPVPREQLSNDFDELIETLRDRGLLAEQ